MKDPSFYSDLSDFGKNKNDPAISLRENVVKTQKVLNLFGKNAVVVIPAFVIYVGLVPRYVILMLEKRDFKTAQKNAYRFLEKIEKSIIFVNYLVDIATFFGIIVYVSAIEERIVEPGSAFTRNRNSIRGISWYEAIAD